MKIIQFNDIQNLQNNKAKEPHITIHIPIIQASSSSQKELIIVKNAEKDLKAKLLSKGLAKQNIKTTIQNVQKAISVLHATRPFGTLLLYGNLNTITPFYIPIELRQAVYVGSSYYIHPKIINFTKTTTSTNILLLSQKSIRLFYTAHNDVKEIPIGDDGIKPMIQELNIDEVFKDLQTHQEGRGDRVRAKGYHGHGSFKDIHKRLIEKYFQTIDKRIKNILTDSTTPIVLMGVSYVTSMYKKVSKVPNPLFIGPHGNFDTMSIGQIKSLIHNNGV